MAGCMTTTLKLAFNQTPELTSFDNLFVRSIVMMPFYSGQSLLFRQNPFSVKTMPLSLLLM